MLPRGKQFWMPLVWCLSISAAVFGVFAFLREKGALQSLELLMYDKFIQWTQSHKPPQPPITFVGVTEEDIQELNHYPISDQELATALKNLLTYNPRAIGLDIFRDIRAGEGGEELDEVLTRNPNIVVIYKIRVDTGGILPPKALQDPKFAGQIGFNDLPEDSKLPDNKLDDPAIRALAEEEARKGADRITRRALLLMENEKDETVGSFGLQLALLYLKKENLQLRWDDPAHPDLPTIGQMTFVPFESTDGPYVNADSRGYQMPMDFKNGSNFSEPVRFLDALRDNLDGKKIAGKIVLMGLMKGEGMKDYVYTPLGKGAGVECHANAIDQILRGALNGQRPITSIWPSQKIAWLALWSLLGGLLGLTVRSPQAFAGWAIFGTAAIGVIGFLAFRQALFIPVIPPVFAWFTSAGLATSYMSFREVQDRRALMTLFGRHVSKDVARAIWNKRDEFLEKGRLIAQEMTATVLFTDLKGFSSVSETMTPGVLMNWLNDYFQLMSGLVEEHGGSINKYAGDSIMALFGPPLTRTTPEEISADVSHAIDCALQMRIKLAEMNARWQSQNPPKPTTQMRIGICTGPLVAGSLGSKERLEYTVIGDTVNVSSRLESFDKNLMDDDIAAHGCRILISDSTLKKTVGQYNTRPIGSVHLHGKKEEVVVHGVIGRATPAQMAQQNSGQRSENTCVPATSNLS